MAGESVSFEVAHKELPYIAEAYQYAEERFSTGGGQRNRNFAAGKTNADILPFPMQELVFDPQTSGGLLICVEEGSAEGLLKLIQEDDPYAKIIGKVVMRRKEVITYTCRI
jgi:selenide,water dikinase